MPLFEITIVFKVRASNPSKAWTIADAVAQAVDRMDGVQISENDDENAQVVEVNEVGS